MKSAELRQVYLDFYAKRGHQILASSPLVPANDPTLLFANSGMVQFKDTFLGFEQRPYSRATTSQKCMRVAGKHNDLDAVGPSPRHHTFFEMLGNFSFGDYFKRDAIQFAWDFITQELKLPVNRLWFSVYTNDDEAVALWQEVGADPARILRFGEKDNFWSMGDTGPCGPNSEIHYYQGDDPDNQTPDGVNSEDDMYMEFWNLVFMQYDRDSNGTLTPLPRPSIDTGMGFERVAAILQGVRNNYETDLFQPIVRRIIELVGKGEEAYRANFAPYHAIADHSRACAFLIADGVRPGNEGRNYVLRRILRRAAYLGQTLGLSEPFLAQTAAVVINEMGDAYPELRTKGDYILRVIAAEEERFRRTLVRGLDQLEGIVARMTRDGQTIMQGADAFRLHDTYGFPLDLTAKILNERGLGVDEGGFSAEMEQQRQRSQQATRGQRAGGGGIWGTFDLPRTVFTGYNETQTFARVLAIVADGEAVDDVAEGDQVQVVFDQTALYGESGGQVGDTGTFVGPHGTLRILDTQKPLPNVFVHRGVIESGTVSVGEAGEIGVDVLRRRDIMRNHTATHLLHRALRDVLGEHAEQAGSLVAPDRLRFDFGHPQSVTADELHEIERRVNAWVRADSVVSPAEMSRAAAEQLAATALFGEKYGDIVRVVTVGCAEGDTPTSDGEDCTHIHARPSFCSRELCGGTHVDRTGEIGYFRILGESSVGSGLRRIEATTGRGAEAYVENQSSQLRDLSGRLGVGVNQLGDRLNQLLAQLRQQQSELAQLQRGQSAATLDQLLASRQQSGDVTFVAARADAPSVDALRELGDRVRDNLRSGVVVLGTIVADKPQIIAMVTPDLVKRGVHAGKLVKALAAVVGGGGGGRPDVAQAGGRDAAKLDEALGQVATLLAEQTQ